MCLFAYLAEDKETPLNAQADGFILGIFCWIPIKPDERYFAPYPPRISPPRARDCCYRFAPSPSLLGASTQVNIFLICLR